MTDALNAMPQGSFPKFKYCLSPQEGATLRVGVVVAMGINNEIGEKGTMPWYLPEDLKHFRECTSESCVVMGRRTFESIGKALPKRRNIVISRAPSIELQQVKGIEIVNSLQAALELAKTPVSHQREEQIAKEAQQCGACFVQIKYQRVFIIGGANLFKSALDFAHDLIITKINASFPNADTFFPKYQDQNVWRLVKAQPEADYDYMMTSGAQPSEFKQERADCRENLSYRFEWYERI